MNIHKLQVFYDGQCVLCSKEIDFYKSKPRQELIEWIDISQPGFLAEDFRLDSERVNARFHAIENGQIYEGIDAFQKIWNVLGIFRVLNWSAKNKALRPLLNFSYDLFVKARPYLPRKNNTVCDDNSCTPRDAKSKGQNL